MSKRSNQREHAADGFTIIELMVVVLIIAILAGLVLSIAGIAGKKADISKAKSEMEFIKNALEEKRIEQGVYPDSMTTLGTNRPVTDPWGRDYKYEVETPKKMTFKLWSLGPDGQDGSADDVNLSKGQ